MAMIRWATSAVVLAALCGSAPGSAEVPGFPVPLGGDCFSTPLVADFNADGKLEIAVAVDKIGERGAVFVIDAAGQALPGWPVVLPTALGTTQLAQGPLLPGDPTPQIAVGTTDGKLHLFTSKGVEAPGFPVDVGAHCSRCFIVKLGPGGRHALVGASPSGKLVAYDGTGQALPGWPRTIAGGLAGDVEATDWDGDGQSELLVLAQGGALHIVNLDGEPEATLPLQATSFCTGDFRPEAPGLEVLAANRGEGTATLYGHDGAALPGWPVQVPHAALPTAIRISRDGLTGALVVDQAQDKPERTGNTIHLFGPDGRELPGWPAAPQFVAGYTLFSRPASADVDGDGQSEIFFGHTCYAVIGLRADGSRLQGFPLRNVGMVYATPTLAHLTSNRRYDLIFADVSSVRSLHAFTLPYDSAPWQAHRPTAAETRRGFVLTGAAPFATILPDAPMVEGQVLGRLEVTACAGEYEPATFVVHALRDVEVTLRPADLTATGGKIPAANLDLRLVHVWRQRRPDSPGEYLVPELLLKRDPGEMKGIISHPLTPEVTTRVPAATARQMWVTVHVPEGARPGTYEGKLALATGGTTIQVPLRVRVLPLRLPADPFVHSIYFHGSSVGLGWYGEKEMSREAWLARGRRQLADLKAHGLNAAESFTPVTMTTQGDGYTYDLANLRQSLALHKEAGLTKWAVIELGYSRLDGQQLHPRLGPKFYRAFEALVGAVEQLARQDHWPPRSHYAVDEPARQTKEYALKYYGFEDPIEVCRLWFEAIRAGGGYTTSAVYHTEVGGWPILGPLCDVPIYSLGSIYPGLSPQDLIGEMNRGRTKQAWYYWQCWTENPLENRLLAGLYLCKSGLSGVMPWDYMGYAGDPYDDFDGPGKDMCLAYPSQEGPVPTLAWEAYREGVDDCRYYAAVKERPEARKLLERLSWSNSQNGVSLTASDLEDLRGQLRRAAGY
jgi:hypothetical protein